MFKHLPPFAADYSGVASALHDLGGLIVIHDASGCTGSFTGYDEPRWYAGRAGVYCSGLREFDAILGNDQRLLDNILDIVRAQDFSFVAIVGSPVPMLIGFDFEGFANLVENESGLPAFGFPTTGLACYHHGFASACIAFADRFLPKKGVRRRAGTLNILGASPLDNFTPATVDLLKACVADLGWSVTSVWGQGSEFSRMAEAASAEVNLVVSSTALPLARHMERRWGIPCVAGIPFDDRAAAALAQALRQAREGMAAAAAPPASPLSRCADQDAGSVLLIGEQFQMNGLRSRLRQYCSGVSIAVGSFFAWDASFAEAGDTLLGNEEEALRLLQARNFDVVVGDPLFRSLLGHAPHTWYVDNPHYAVSGRIHREHALATHFGASGLAFARQIEAAVLASRATGSRQVRAS
ncbi:nitrogenase component 1 [Propionivibrio sp.]|uniref:nitrogenase component 1 n=1 Tax=Propionivibrio sp. TaxID=2212460 RepID=UPI0039E503D6